MAKDARKGGEAGEARDPLEGKLLLTIPEVARALGLSTRTIWKLINEGKLKRVHPTPRSSRVTRESLEAFLRSLEKGEEEVRVKGIADRAREVLKRFGL
ncbi:helix-turn-helix transcriptional regulator [Thermus scotoductus]|uniref:DNA-binding protein n=2 Tax=Thermus TaxID=270 RepID=A0A430RXN2_THESC|nr:MULTISPECIES: helix-turn-helix domain-containing protein [Thermus]RTH25672.1 DNA-binding protein [Thermus scotoductus]BDG17780.1 hypothetical protein TbrSNM41_25140 [Thermus brockianus]